MNRSFSQKRRKVELLIWAHAFGLGNAAKVEME